MTPESIDVSGICEGATPPKTVGLDLEVVRIVNTSPRQFVFLSEKAWGAWFHWIGRSVPCSRPAECERCTRSKAKWRGYIHAFEFLAAGKKSVIIELTLPALALIEMQLALQPLRGTQVKLAKTKGGKHGRFLVEVLGRRVDPATLPPAANPQTTLEWLWKINEGWDRPKPEIE